MIAIESCLWKEGLQEDFRLAFYGSMETRSVGVILNCHLI